MTTFSISRVPAIAPQYCAGLRPWLRFGQVFNAYDLRYSIGLGVTEATSLMFGLAEDEHVHLVLKVYHSCSKEHVAVRAYALGFQPTPWVCPWCSEPVSSADELTYAFTVSMRHDVELVP